MKIKLKSTRDNFQTIKKMDMEYLRGLTVKFMMDIGKMAKCMVRLLQQMQKEDLGKENG